MKVVDASVAVKWFLPETGSDEADALFTSGEELVAPWLIRIEVAGAIASKVRRGEIEQTDGAQALGLWLQFVASKGITLIREGAHLPVAWSVAAHLKHPLQDCVYLAVSNGLHAPLITADLKFANKAGRHGQIKLLTAA